MMDTTYRCALCEGKYSDILNIQYCQFKNPFLPKTYLSYQVHTIKPICPNCYTRREKLNQYKQLQSKRAKIYQINKLLSDLEDSNRGKFSTIFKVFKYFQNEQYAYNNMPEFEAWLGCKLLPIHKQMIYKRTCYNCKNKVKTINAILYATSYKETSATSYKETSAYSFCSNTCYLNWKNRGEK